MHAATALLPSLHKQSCAFPSIPAMDQSALLMPCVCSLGWALLPSTMARWFLSSA